ncbi:IclR family transcriptional regulator [Corynebacterium aquatimens]|uniref:IclR family transcriptional regulator n=1 Tax=Corynebacterium TaxID=1716 RepID=UPI001F2F0499|nr:MULTISPECIES: IclR family transcriptional regulator [Corynebacterium]QYH19094.1 IclR family transcriptional regulator [Corynebacterium aquatimens]UIZ92052.1 IclR family transcriptional regulator [Corynebacterium sp. CNCTC7651]
MNKPQVPAAHNVLRILALLSTTDAPISATRIQRELGLPRSTTYHLLRELEDSGFVVHLSSSSTYGLGLASYRMAQAYTTQQPLVRLATKPLARIAELAGGSSHLSRLAGSEIVYLHEVRAPGAVSLITEVGVRLPSLATASGRIMLAQLPETELRAVFNASGERRRYSEVKEQLAAYRRQGFADEHEEISPGQESLAVAVLDHLSRPAAALAVTFAVGSANREQLVAALSAAAAHLRTQFFGTV